MNGSIAGTPGKATFRRIQGYAEMLSGLADRYDPKHLARIDDEVRAHGGRTDEIEVDCYRLNDHLTQHDLQKIHHMNIDVAGAEYEILQSIDFDALDILVCGVENNYKDYRIARLMKSRGYRMIAVVGDEFYVKHDAHGETRVR